MTLRFVPNLFILWPDLPLQARFARAARRVRRLELWWPGDDGARLLPGLTARWDWNWPC